MDAPIRHRPSKSGSKSSALELFYSKESGSSNCSFDSSDSGDDEGEEMEEEEEEEEEDEMSIRLQIIPKRTLGMTQMPMHHDLLDLPTINPTVLLFFFFLFMYLFCLAIYWLKL